jgi:flavin-binding protein dodecin
MAGCRTGNHCRFQGTKMAARNNATRTAAWMLALALALPGGALAQSPANAGAPAATHAPADASPAVRDLETIVVTGVQPGPGMWRVSKGDHVLWVLGTLSPLPRDFEWDSNAVEKVVSQSQEVLSSPSVVVNTSSGFFGNLALIPSALKARRNPDGKRLQEVVPSAQYQRWLALKARYIGRNSGIEQWRPVFAALELYNQAIEKSRMSSRGIVGPALAKMANRYGVKITNPKVTITIQQPRQALKEFAATSLDDLDCFGKTLDRIESDLGTMAARANAWAIGDIQTLRELPYGNQFTACSAAFSGAALARKHGIADMAGQMERKWTAAAEAALAKNRTTFATLPIAEVLKTDGYLAKLKARGYEVEAP